MSKNSDLSGKNTKILEDDDPDADDIEALKLVQAKKTKTSKPKEKAAPIKEKNEKIENKSRNESQNPLLPEDNSITIDQSSMVMSSLNIDKPIMPKKKAKDIEKIVEEKSDDEKVVNTKQIFEGLVFLYQQQKKLEDNQQRIEEKLDLIIKMLKK